MRVFNPCKSCIINPMCNKSCEKSIKYHNFEDMSVIISFAIATIINGFLLIILDINYLYVYLILSILYPIIIISEHYYYYKTGFKETIKDLDNNSLLITIVLSGILSLTFIIHFSLLLIYSLRSK